MEKVDRKEDERRSRESEKQIQDLCNNTHHT